MTIEDSSRNLEPYAVNPQVGEPKPTPVEGVKRFRLHLQTLKPRVIKDVFDIFVRTASTEPEFYTDQEYLKDGYFLKGFNPRRAHQEILRRFKVEPVNPVSICSDHSATEEGVLFQLRPYGSDLVEIVYDPADRIFWDKEGVDEKEALFDQAVNEYLIKKGLAVEPPAEENLEQEERS